LTDDLEGRYTEGNGRGTYRALKAEKTRRQYYLNMNPDVAEQQFLKDLEQ